MCLQCMEFFDLPKQTNEYVEHLLSKHKIVITDIELIVDLKRYLISHFLLFQFTVILNIGVTVWQKMLKSKTCFRKLCPRKENVYLVGYSFFILYVM
jgi:hypothetical protein